MAEKKKGSKTSRRKARKRASKVLARRVKEFTYKGKTVEELKAMSLDQIIQLLPARARRSLKRGFTEEQQKLLNALRNSGPDEVIKTHRREMVILPEMVGRKIAIHNGKEFKIMEIQPEMIGHFLGEFAQTRFFAKHAGPGVGATRSSKYMPLK
jgi:small subunit ribosomal protein S19